MHSSLTAQEWASFRKLPGAATANFESLWRALVRASYGRYGVFKEYKSYKGIEFSLQLKENVDGIGRCGDVVGWQCKFYDRLFDGKRLNGRQKDDILGSLRLTRADSPAVTIWYLCVPQKLSKTDIDWLLGNNAQGLAVRCWNDEDISHHFDIADRGALIREAYFGRLALTTDDLLYASRMMYEPIKSRWLKDVHFCTEAEQRVRKLLYEPTSRTDFHEVSVGLSHIKEFVKSRRDEDSKLILNFLSCVQEDAESLQNCILKGEYYDANPVLDRAKEVYLRLLTIQRMQARKRLSIAPMLYNALYYIKKLASVAKEIADDLKVSTVAIVADAGCGKTHLSISLVENGCGQRQGGLLLLGKMLARGCSFDRLVENVNFPSGKSVENVQELLAALNEYGERNACRVPLVVDGLNEAQNPQEWHDILARLNVLLQLNFPRVLLVVTLRTGQCSTSRMGYEPMSRFSDEQVYAYRKMCIPDGILSLDGKPPSGEELIDKYFGYYRISSSSYSVPTILLHPLSLRLYCDAINGKRERAVVVKDLPYDITGIFDLFCDEIARHLTTDCHLAVHKQREDYRICFRKLGFLLWERGNRFALVSDLQKIFPTVTGDWCSAWENILAQEGLILVRPDWEDKDVRVFEVAYDALAGYLVADAMTSKSDNWLKECLRSERFFANVVERKHLLADDILSNLTWLYPRKNLRQMLYEIAPPELHDSIVRRSLDMDGEIMTKSLISELIKLCKSDGRFARRCYSRVFARPLDSDHPINPLFLDEILLKLGCAERDGTWGRWVYENRQGLYGRIDSMLTRIRSLPAALVNPVFICLKWLLVTNVCSLRDKATHCLVEMGIRHPKLTLDCICASLGCNDPYVVERLAASAYGILMGLNSLRQDDLLWREGSRFACYVVDHVLSERAEWATCNMLTLDALVNCIALVQQTQSRVGGDVRVLSFKFPYVVARHFFREHKNVDSRQCMTVDDAIHMDFSNYTMTRLVSAHPYETGGSRYKKARALIEQRMYDLGYRCADFKEEDRHIANNRHRPEFDRDKLHVERFGKKYSWIAYREMEAVLRKRIYPYNRTSELDIDLSFPGSPRIFPITFDDGLFDGFNDVEDWVRRCHVPRYECLRECKIPGFGNDNWVLVYGAIDRESDDKLRNCYTMIKGFIVQRGMMSFLQREPEHLNRLESIQRYDSYVGESPWSKQLRYSEDEPRRRLNNVRPNRVKFLVYSDKKWDYFSWYDCPYEFFNAESFESDENVNGTGHLLAYDLMYRLNMRVNPCSWEMIDDQGAIGGVYFKDGESYNTERRLLYIRKDLLLRYLNIVNGQFGWVVSGEKRMHYNEMPKHHEFYESIKEEDVSFSEVEEYIADS